MGRMKAEFFLSDQRVLAERDMWNQRSTIEFVHSGPAGLSTQPVRKMDAVVDEVKPAQPVQSSD